MPDVHIKLNDEGLATLHHNSSSNQSPSSITELEIRLQLLDRVMDRRGEIPLAKSIENYNMLCKAFGLTVYT